MDPPGRDQGILAARKGNGDAAGTIRSTDDNTDANTGMDKRSNLAPTASTAANQHACCPGIELKVGEAGKAAARGLAAPATGDGVFIACAT